MTKFYNEIAGRNLARLEALSDGVFAVGMTLLVLDLRAPAASAIHSEHALIAALAALAPRLLTYLMSFLTLGIFWVGQQSGLDMKARSNRDFAWLHMAFLVAVTLLPFSTALLAEFFTYRAALLVYWANIAALGWLLFLSWKYAQRAGLVKPDVPIEVQNAIDRRIIIGQSLYALGAALCVINTTWSVFFIVGVQLQYAIAPKFKPFSWL
jgi:uncharacterized membrane protein